MTFDDLPFHHPGEAPPMPSETRARKCRRHVYQLLDMGDRTDTLNLRACTRCGKPYNPVASRRGRTSRRAGHDAERLVERETGLTKVGEIGSPVDVGDAASWAIGQDKAGHRYSLTDEADLDRMAAEAHGRPRLLFKVKRPGPGHARRVTVTLRLSEFIAEHGDALVTLDLPDWQELHG